MCSICDFTLLSPKTLLMCTEVTHMQKFQSTINHYIIFTLSVINILLKFIMSVLYKPNHNNQCDVTILQVFVTQPDQQLVAVHWAAHIHTAKAEQD